MRTSMEAAEVRVRANEAKGDAGKDRRRHAVGHAAAWWTTIGRTSCATKALAVSREKAARAVALQNDQGVVGAEGGQ